MNTDAAADANTKGDRLHHVLSENSNINSSIDGGSGSSVHIG